MFFVLLRPIFCEKWKIAPPYEKSPPSNVWSCEIGRKIALNFGEDLFFFFFWRSPYFGRKKRLNFGFRPKNHSEFWRRPFFFGDHLILGGKNLWISDHSKTFRLKFRTNRLKLIQGQWKFESRWFAHFLLFQNSPPPPFSKSWLRAWICIGLFWIILQQTVKRLFT